MAKATELLFGPYTTPLFKYGDDACCALHGDVILCGLTDARIPWPVSKRMLGALPRSLGRTLRLVHGTQRRVS